MIPHKDQITREHVFSALAEIDKNGVPDHRLAKGFDLVHDGKKYPPKYVVSLAGKYAIGEELHGFKGGAETNAFLRSLGFEIEEREIQSIRDNLERVMAEYLSARSQPFGKSHPVWSFFTELKRGLRDVEAIAACETLKVKFSVGNGNWANVPWVAFLDSRETDSTQHGVYPVFLFRQDMTGVYLTLAQGVTEPKKKLGARPAREFLRDNAAGIRQHLGPLFDSGFTLDSNIDLRADDQVLGSDYVDSAIAHKFYSAGQVPDDDTLEADIEAVVSAYDNYLIGGNVAQTQAWMFQASPQYYNIMGAVKALPQQTWLVSAYKQKIKAGHRVYLWEAGPEAGVIGSATVVEDPSEMDAKADEAPFMVDPSKFAGPQFRALLRIDRVFDKRLLRRDLQNDEILKNLAVIKFAQATNYVVTPEEAQRIEELVGGAMTMTTDATAALVAAVFMSKEQLEEIRDLLLEKRQLILEGPPGSGKTFLATRFARYFVGLPINGGSEPQVRIVQFHQSYSYEDFVEGIRPDATAEQIAYKVVPGIFKRLCDDARLNSDKKYILIIDEINRGNLSRIFGELLMLLEYREMKVELPYQIDGEQFSIPKNLYIIGTMNTTDRSLAQIDYALRRRFYFYRLMPVVGDSAPVLSRWLDTQPIAASEKQKVLSLFIGLNKRVTDQIGEHFQIGHSYFMHQRVGTEAGRLQIWDRAIMPLLEEYFHNRKERQKVLAEFAIDKVAVSSITASAGQ